MNYIGALPPPNRAATGRQAQILDEACRLVAERGYYGFGIQELATRCGLTKPGLLHHFKSKDQLLISVLQDRDQRDQDAIAEVMANTAAADLSGGATLSLKGVGMALRAIVARNAQQPELVRLYAVLRAEALNPGHPAHAYFNVRESLTLEAFTALVAPHCAAPRSLARQLIASMIGLEMQWLRENLGFDLVQEWDRLVARIDEMKKPQG